MFNQSRLKASWEKVTIAAVAASLVLTPFVTAPVSAGVYACPDMTGPGGLADGHVDASDLSAFAAAKGAQTPNGDFNADGPVDAIDQAMFAEVFGQSDFSCEKYWSQLHSGTPACLDMTHDGAVDASDVSAFAAAKGKQDLAADFSGDRQVDVIDQAMLENVLGTSPYYCGIVASPNPEPPPPTELVPPEPGPTAQVEPQPVPITLANHPVKVAPPAPTTSNHLTLPVEKPKPVVPGTENHQANGNQATPDPETIPVDWIGPDAPGGSPVSSVADAGNDAATSATDQAATPSHNSGFLAGALAMLSALGAKIVALLSL